MAYKMSWPDVDWYTFFIHLRSSNVHHFGMVEDRRSGVDVNFNGMISPPNFIKMY
jgi:hypothetical protein